MDHFKQDILKIIHKLKVHKRWKKYVTPEMAKDIVVERMSGALTNAVYCVSPPPYIKDVIKMSKRANIIAGVDQKTGNPVKFSIFSSPSLGPVGNNDGGSGNDANDGGKSVKTVTKENTSINSNTSSNGTTIKLSDLGAGPHDAYKSRANSTAEDFLSFTTTSTAINDSAKNTNHPISTANSSTNLVTKLPPKLLLRIYGPHADNLIDRESELNILARLSKRHIGPRLLGTFANGRFEQFLEAKALTKDDLRNPEVSVQIAKRMRELHDLIKLDEESERSKGPESFTLIGNWLKPAEKKLNELQKIVDKQREIGQSKKSGKSGKSTKGRKCYKKRNIVKEVLGVETFKEFQDAVTKYQTWLQCEHAKLSKGGDIDSVFNPKPANKPSENSISTQEAGKSSQETKLGLESIKQSLVFAHNDTQYGNLLRVLPPPGSPLLAPVYKYRQIIVIDFEYSGANVRGYDIVNHFCEWMSDYTGGEEEKTDKNKEKDDKTSENEPWRIHLDKYPSTKQRHNMIQAYVEHGYTTRSMSATASASPKLGSSTPVPASSNGGGGAAAKGGPNPRTSFSNLSISSSSLGTGNPSTNGNSYSLSNNENGNVDTTLYFDDEAIDAETKYLEKEAMAWRAMVSAFWGVWGLVQANVGVCVEADDEIENSVFEQVKAEEGEKEEKSESESGSESVESEELEDEEEEEDLFDYVAYSKEKVKLFWGDLIKYGIVEEDELEGQFSVIEMDYK